VADRELGRLLDAAGPEVNVLVFSTIGLRPNEAATQLLDHAMIALGYHVPSRSSEGTSARRRMVEVGTRITPRFLRHRLRAMLPGGSYESLADSSWGESIDWARSRAPSEAEPGSAWIRLNLAGREPEGIVSAEERERLVDEIREDLTQLVDDATGKPAIDEVLRVSEIVGGENVGDLPDLLVRWAPGLRIRAVRHPRVGRITDHGAHHARTEHTGAGFLAAAGPDFAPGATPGLAREIDLAPTVLSLFGCPVPRAMEGEPLAGLLRRSGEAPRADIDLAITPSWESSRESGG